MSNELEQETSNDPMNPNLRGDEGGGVAKDAAEIHQPPASHRLMELVSLYFPQYGPIDFERIPVRSSNVKVEDDMSTEGTVTSSKLRCRVEMFGVPVESEESFTDWDSAREATATIALRTLEDFLNLVRCRVDETVFGRILAPLVKELEAYQVPPKSGIRKQEEKMMEVGHNMVILAADEEADGSSRAEYLGPFLNGTFNKMRYPKLGEQPMPTEPNPPPTIAKTEDTSSREENPMSILHQHYQKRSNQVAAPTFEHFARTRYWGVIGRYLGHEVTVKAVFLRKNDAKWEAARLLCQKVLGDLITFRSIPPDKTDESNIAVTGESGDVVVAVSKAIITDEASTTTPILVSKSMLGSTNGTAIEDLDASMSKEFPSGPLEQRNLADRSFVSIVNDFVQKTHLPHPDFVFLNVNQSLTRAFCCRVADFDGKTFMSYAFTRKQDAKDDCAGRIVLYMLEKGLIDAQGQVIMKRPAMPPPPPWPFPHPLSHVAGAFPPFPPFMPPPHMPGIPPLPFFPPLSNPLGAGPPFTKPRSPSYSSSSSSLPSSHHRRNGHSSDRSSRGSDGGGKSQRGGYYRDEDRHDQRSSQRHQERHPRSPSPSYRKKDWEKDSYRSADRDRDYSRDYGRDRSRDHNRYRNQSMDERPSQRPKT